MNSSATRPARPNVVYFLVDNLGMGELSSYSAGPLRGVSTTRIDTFASEGMMLLNFGAANIDVEYMRRAIEFLMAHD